MVLATDLHIFFNKAVGGKNLVIRARKYLFNNLPIIIPLILLIPFYYVLYKLYIPRITAFGCFDDCFNYLGGYFIANGKHIYSDFFFNHQPIPAIISYFVQTATHPINIFELILRHRQFLLLFGFLFNALFIIRFKYVALPFILAFELSKFYVFGDRFLAEGLVVYPLVYLFGLALLKLNKQKLLALDYLLSAIFSWFVIFSREPYIPLALLLFPIIIWRKFERIKKVAIGVFVLLFGLTLLYIGDLKEYFFNIVTFNLEAVLPRDINVSMFGPKPFHIFFYPLYIFFYGSWNIVRQFLVGINVLFIAYFLALIKNKSYKLALFIPLILGLANLRVIIPGTLFYESFHMIIWYAIFLFTTSFLIFNYSKNTTIKLVSLGIFFLLLFSFVTSKSYFSNDKVDEHTEFFTNYGPILHAGETIKALSSPRDTLFLDRSDDLIYWQAKRLSSYKYVWYTSQMNSFPKYTDERLRMFKTNPPDFYKEFGTCPKKVTPTDASLPSFVRDQYIRLYSNNEPSCLFVRKDKLKEISDSQWKKAEEFLYSLPK